MTDRTEPRTDTEKREELTRLLDERGLSEAQRFVWELGDGANLDGALNAVAQAQAEGLDSQRLLAYRVKQAAKSGYVPPEQREGVSDTGNAGITQSLIRSVRAGCKCPDGMTREEARGLYDTAAKARGVPVDRLIDAAMGPDWQGSEATA